MSAEETKSNAGKYLGTGMVLLILTAFYIIVFLFGHAMYEDSYFDGHRWFMTDFVLPSIVLGIGTILVTGFAVVGWLIIVLDLEEDE